MRTFKTFNTNAREALGKGGERLKFIRVSESVLPHPVNRGFDPEMIYVECSRCGAPVLWERGRSTEIFKTAGIDPLELDASCMLVSDGCPACSRNPMYSVRMLRISTTPPSREPASKGHA